MSYQSKIDPPCDAQRNGEVAAAQRLTEGQGANGPSTTTPAASRSRCGSATPAVPPSLCDREDQVPATHFSRDKQAQFLDALAQWGNARAACRAVSVSPQTAYRHRRNSRDFAVAWDAAMIVAKPRVEDVLADRALNGIEEVIYYHGEEIGRRRRYHSRLLLAHLARLDKAEAEDTFLDPIVFDFDTALDRLRRGETVNPNLIERDDGDDEDADGAEGVTYGEAWEDESLPFPERVELYQRWFEACDEAADDLDDEYDAAAEEYGEDDEEQERAEHPLGLSQSDVALFGQHDDVAALDAILARCGPDEWVSRGHAARLAAYKAQEKEEARSSSASGSADQARLAEAGASAEDARSSRASGSAEMIPSQDSVTPVTLSPADDAAAADEAPGQAEAAVDEPASEEATGFRRLFPLDRNDDARRLWPGGPINDGRLQRML